MEILTKAVTIVVGFLYGLVSYGYVGTILWSWFIVPVFHLNPITIFQSIGIGLIVNFWTYKPDFTHHEQTKNIGLICFPLIFPWFMLFIAWIVKLVMN